MLVEKTLNDIVWDIDVKILIIQTPKNARHSRMSVHKPKRQLTTAV